MKRKIVSYDANSPRQVYEESLIGFFLSLLGLILLLYISEKFKLQKQMSPIIKVIGLICLFSLIIFIVSELLRETVPTFQIPHMKIKQKVLSWLNKLRFNDRNIIYTLNIANKTDRGYEIPNIRVYIAPKIDNGFIAIENMGGKINQLNNSDMISAISGLLSTRKLRRFSIVSSELSQDGNYVLFYFEDTKTSQRLIIWNHNVIPYVSSNCHELRLSKDLTWKVDGSTPHLAIIGRTRSGKSYFVGEYLLPLMRKQNWIVRFYSVKNDIYVDRYHGEFDPKKIIESLEQWVDLMNRRNSEIKRNGKSKYTQMPNMLDVGLIIDEIGNLNGSLSLDRKLKLRWENAIGKLTATGASAGIHIIAMSQYATKESFLPSTARANVSDAVIMLGLAADNATDRQYVLPGFELPSRSYDTGQGIASIVSAGHKWEKPHYFETPLFK